MWALGQNDVRNEASGIGVAGGEVEKAMREVIMNPGASSPCVFHRSDVEGSGVVDGDEFVIVMRQLHAKEIAKHSRSKWDVEVQKFEPGDD